MSGLRSLLQGGGALAVPGVYDAYSARLVESLGHRAVYLGGNAVGLQLVKGQPFVDARDMAEAVARVHAAVAVPIVADAAAGFGDPAHVHRAVRDLERAGAAALHIDDQVHPKRAHYHLGRGRLVETDTMIARLQAALAARRDEGVMVFARTDALRVTRSIDAAIDRARRYAKTGIDGLVVLDAGPAEARALAQALPGLPLAWLAGPSPAPPTLDELGAAGFALALYPFQSSVAVTEALLATWQPLGATGRPGAPRGAVKPLLDTALDLVEMPTYWDIERRTVEPPSAEPAP